MGSCSVPRQDYSAILPLTCLFVYSPPRQMLIFFPAQNLTLTHLPEAFVVKNKPEAAEAVGRVMSCDL